MSDEEERRAREDVESRLLDAMRTFPGGTNLEYARHLATAVDITYALTAPRLAAMVDDAYEAAAVDRDEPWYVILARLRRNVAVAAPKCGKCGEEWDNVHWSMVCASPMPVDSDSQVTPYCRRRSAHDSFHCDHMRVWDQETSPAEKS